LVWSFRVEKEIVHLANILGTIAKAQQQLHSASWKTLSQKPKTDERQIKRLSLSLLANLHVQASLVFVFPSF